MTRFHECLALTLREESGEVQLVGGPYVRGRWSFMDHPRDPGGATMMGVTHRVYAAYLRSRGLPQKNVREVTDEEIEDIYHGNYWQLVAGDSLPRGLDLAVFDFAVNSGPHRAICKLQSVLGVKVDGQLGLANATANLQYPGQSANGAGVRRTAPHFVSRWTAVNTGTPGGTDANNDVWMFAFDGDANKIWRGLNGTWNNSGDPGAGTNEWCNSVTDTVYPMAGFFTSGGGKMRLVVDSGSFAYSPPSGFSAWNLA